MTLELDLRSKKKTPPIITKEEEASAKKSKEKRPNTKDSPRQKNAETRRPACRDEEHDGLRRAGVRKTNLVARKEKGPESMQRGGGRLSREGVTPRRGRRGTKRSLLRTVFSTKKFRRQEKNLRRGRLGEMTRGVVLV